MNKSLFVVLAIALFCFSGPFVSAQTDSTTTGVPVAAADNSTNTTTPDAPVAAAADNSTNTNVTDASGAPDAAAAPSTETTTEATPEASAAQPTVVAGAAPVESSSEESGEVEVTVAEDGSVIGSNVESDPNAVTVDNTESGAVATQDSANNSGTTAAFLALSGKMMAASGVVIAMSAVLLM